VSNGEKIHRRTKLCAKEKNLHSLVVQKTPEMVAVPKIEGMEKKKGATIVRRLFKPKITPHLNHGNAPTISSTV
jgi:hypothetical protein